MSTTPTGNPVIDALTASNPPSPPAPPTTPASDAPITQVVNGKSVTKPLSEWLTAAQKAEGAEEKFRLAAEAIQVKDAVDKLYDPAATEADRTAATRFLYQRAGVSEDPTPTPNPSTKADGTSTAPSVDPRVSALIGKVEHYEALTSENYERQLKETVEEAVSKTDSLRVYLGSSDSPAPAGRKDMLVNVLHQKALEMMQARRAAGEKFSPGWIREAVETAKPETVKYAELVIGAPSSLGRAAETMLGPQSKELLSKQIPQPTRGASRASLEQWMKSELLKTALSAPNDSTSRV